MEHVVYGITGKKSGELYIGYCAGETPLESFLIGATRGDAASADRGDVRLFQANGEDAANLTVEIIDVFTDEIDAFICRNEQRAQHSHCITGPTMFPGKIAERAAKERPADMYRISERMKMRTAKTARAAWGLGMWTNESIKALLNRFKRDEIMADLDALTPDQFDIKYQPGTAA